jgi:hypothetical protein
MKKGRIFGALFVFLFLLATSADASSNNRRIFRKGSITEISDYTITAVKNGKTYTINAESALLMNGMNGQTTISQFYVGDQIDVRGRTATNGTILAKIVEDQSIKGTELNRRSNVGSGNIKNGSISNASIASNANIASSKIDLSNLNFGSSTLRDGNFTGNWNFNSGNLLGINSLHCESLFVNGEINLPKNSSEPYACDSAHDGNIALTDFYVTCVCKNGTGWVFTSDGTTACTWQSPGPRDLDPILAGREMTFPVAANTVIPQNNLVCANTSGYAIPCADTAGNRFVGISKEAADNTGGASGDEWVSAYQQGNFSFSALSITQAQVGSSMYVINGSSIDDATGPTNDVRVGILVKYISATEGWINIDQ